VFNLPYVITLYIFALMNDPRRIFWSMNNNTKREYEIKIKYPVVKDFTFNYKGNQCRAHYMELEDGSRDLLSISGAMILWKKDNLSQNVTSRFLRTVNKLMQDD